VQLRALASITSCLSCLLAIACAHETSERPQEHAPVPRATTSTSLPFPETAFQGNEVDAGVAAAPVDRFATRRIDEGAGEKRARYTGARVDLDVKGADLQDVFRLLADVGHVNIVVSGDVTGTITLKLKNVPWDQALDVIARTKSLDTERDGNVIMVTLRERGRP